MTVCVGTTSPLIINWLRSVGDRRLGAFLEYKYYTGQSQLDMEEMYTCN